MADFCYFLICGVFSVSHVDMKVIAYAHIFSCGISRIILAVY